MYSLKVDMLAQLQIHIQLEHNQWYKICNRILNVM